MAKTPHSGKTGRPEKPINWDLVDRMIEAQCTGVEIAGSCGIYPKTFYIRFRAHHGISFDAYRTNKAQSGLGIIKLAQYQKAINNSSKGNVQMLIYLGKVLLGQKEPSDDIKEEVILLKEQLRLFHEQINAQRNPVKES